MLPVLVFLAGDRPKIGIPSVASIAAGACSGAILSSTAVARLSWTLANPNDGAWQAKIYKDGVLQATQVSSSSSFDYTVTGFKEGAGPNQFTSAFVFRVDIVDKITGAVLATATAATWAQIYSTCVLPAITGVGFTEIDPGSCNGLTQLTPMKGTVAWSISNADPTNTQLKVYNNNVLQGTVAGNATQLTGVTFDGRNDVGNNSRSNVTRTFRVDCVKISDGSLISSSGDFNVTLSTANCGGPA